jgi:GxxExxY protein
VIAITSKADNAKHGPQMTQMGADWAAHLRLPVSFAAIAFNMGAIKEEYPQRELSAQIIGAAMKVLNDLKPGLDEKIYENALVIELVAQGHGVEQQRRFPVHYRGHLLGTLIPDILVDGKIIVDPKVVAAFSDDHLAQMLGYLAITDLELALLLNFRFAKLQWKRVVRSRSDDAL